MCLFKHGCVYVCMYVRTRVCIECMFVCMQNVCMYLCVCKYVRTYGYVNNQNGLLTKKRTNLFRRRFSYFIMLVAYRR